MIPCNNCKKSNGCKYLCNYMKDWIRGAKHRERKQMKKRIEVYENAYGDGYVDGSRDTAEYILNVLLDKENFREELLLLTVKLSGESENVLQEIQHRRNG